MADGTVCDASSNGEVFDDVESDPNFILQNVEQACNKILIPSMAQSAMSKLSTSEQDNEETDVIFTLKAEDVDDASEQNHDETNTTIDVDQKRRLSVNGQSRAVKWTLETMASAMDSVLGGELTTTNAARKYGIPRTTLLDRLAMKVKKQHIETPGTFPLSPENDAKILDFVRENASLQKPTLLRGILRLAEDLANEQGRRFENPLNTRKWLKLFVHKHPGLDILQYSRTRSVSQSHRSALTITPVARNSSTSNTEVLIAPQIIHIQQSPLNSSSSAVQDVDLGNDAGSPHQNMNADGSQSYDSFEATLAKQASESIERKLTTEQRSYFNYRFFNNALERGYELWRLCKSKTESAENENFESILSVQALFGIEHALVEEHLKYFRFRYENPDLDEGYKLWSVLKEKTLHQN